MVLAWAHTIALSDLGRPLQATEIAQAAAALAAASLDAANYQRSSWPSITLRLCFSVAFSRRPLRLPSEPTEQCADVPGVAQTFAAAIRGVAALGNGDVNTATECLGDAVAEFADRADGGSYHFGIYYAKALARAGDLDAADEALAQMQRNRHPAHAYLRIGKPAGRRVGGGRARTHLAGTRLGQGGSRIRVHARAARPRGGVPAGRDSVR